MHDMVRDIWQPSAYPAWLDPARRNGHDLEPVRMTIPRRLAVIDATRWVCAVCGAWTEVQPGSWGGALGTAHTTTCPGRVVA